MKPTDKDDSAIAISVIVPVYNVEKHLKKCVDSIKRQTFRNIEIILVDDGSTDRSAAMCDELAATDTRISVLHKENGGLSDARNAGIKIAKGKYIGLVDSDDYIEEDMYEVLYRNILKENADVSVCSMYSCYGNKVNILCNQGYEVIDGAEMIGLSLNGRKIQVSACIKLYKKELLLETPFTKGRQYEDALLLGELFSKVNKVVIDYTPKYYYIHHDGTITTSKYNRRNLDIIYAYNKNLEIVKKICPQYLDIAKFRLFWAHYKVYDRMLMSDSKEAVEDRREVRHFLRKNYLAMMKNGRIGRGRKIALTGLLVSEKIYKFLVRQEQKRYLLQ